MKKLLVIAAPSMLFIVLFLLLISAKQPEKIESDKIASVVQPPVPEMAYPVMPYKDEMIASVKAYFEKALRKKQIVGAAIAIVKCDSIIYVDGFGNRNAKLKDQIDAETVFRIGSVSKGFGGVLNGIGVEQGLINWEDKVVDHIPSFTLAYKQQAQEITLSNILSHTSGVPYHSFTNLVEDGLSLTNIAALFGKIKPIQKPGVQYSYQNAIFALGGEALERITGQSVKDILKEKIFDPLNMITASASYEGMLATGNMAMPHKKHYGRWKPLRINKKYYNAVTAGGVNASATDMAKWMKFLLGNNPEVLSTKGLKEVFNPMVEIEGRSKYYQRWPGYQKSSYGHGWRIHNFKNKTTGESSTMIHHGGHVNSYRSEIAVLPGEDLGICVLFNSPTKLARTVIPDLYKIITEMTSRPIQNYQDEIVSLTKQKETGATMDSGI